MTARDMDGASDITRLYFLINPTPNIPQNTCHGFYDRIANALFLYNDGLTAITGPLTPGAAQAIQNSQCAINGAATTVVTTATDLTLNLNLTIKTTAATNAYLWPVDTQNTGSGWVRTASWSLAAPNQPPTVVNRQDGFSGSPSTVTFTARDFNGYTDIQRLYFLINTDTNIPQNTCHGFYDRAANALFLYNDSTTALVPGLQNSQCALDASTFRIDTSIDARDLIISLKMSLKPPFANTAKNVYLWALDSQNAETGWVQTGQWFPNANALPAVGTGTPSALSGVNPLSVTIPVSDPDGNANIARIYFLVAASPTPTVNGCHGFYDRPTGGLYLYNDALTSPILGSSQNGQCAVSAAATSMNAASTTSANLTLSMNLINPYLATPKNLYIWIVDQQGNGTGWIQAATWN